MTECAEYITGPFRPGGYPAIQIPKDYRLGDTELINSQAGDPRVITPKEKLVKAFFGEIRMLPAGLLPERCPKEVGRK